MLKINEIINKIKESINPIMDQWESDMFGRIKELEKYCSFTVYDEIDKSIKGINKSYEIHNLKVRKGWSKSIERYFHRSDADLKNMINKDRISKLLKIDIAVKKKLAKVDVKEVELIDFKSSAKDFSCEGSWRINNELNFSFYTIYAGGYNIQQLHIRTLYRLK